jgi:hypothetical protein
MMMKRVIQSMCALLVASAVAVVLAGGGSASVGSTATFSEVTVFGTNHQSPVGTFTTTGLPDCTSGTFSDQVVSFSPSGARVVVDRTYACAEGGTFVVRLALHVSPAAADGSQATSGTWRILSTDGALAGLQGETSVDAVNTGCAPVGAIFAECTAATGTFSVSLH